VETHDVRWPPRVPEAAREKARDGVDLAGPREEDEDALGQRLRRVDASDDVRARVDVIAAEPTTETNFLRDLQLECFWNEFPQ
jgi:hypothetical protein